MRAALAVRPDAHGAARVLGSWQRVDAATARLACLIDPSFLREAGWDPGRRVLSLPHEHPLLGWRACPAPGCGNPVYGDARECGSCRQRAISQPSSFGSPGLTAQSGQTPVSVAMASLPV
jgi:hypothetical protein